LIGACRLSQPVTFASVHVEDVRYARDGFEAGADLGSPLGRFLRGSGADDSCPFRRRGLQEDARHQAEVFEFPIFSAVADDGVLQGGIEEAERHLGYKVMLASDEPAKEEKK